MRYNAGMAEDVLVVLPTGIGPTMQGFVDLSALRTHSLPKLGKKSKERWAGRKKEREKKRHCIVNQL
jgi:hypothetical protein